MIALRHSMLSSGFTVGMIWVYQRRAATGLSARSWSSWSLQHLRERRRLHAGAGDVDVLVTGDDLVVEVVGLQSELHVDLVRQRLAVGVGRGVPVGVAHQRATRC